jgi:RimJ/RimL family protein N-acetyltransferase
MILYKIKTFINDFVFKTRYVFATAHLPFHDILAQQFYIIKIETLDINTKNTTVLNCIDFLLKYISKEKLQSRLSLSRCAVFLAVEKENNQPVGYCWAIKAEEKPIWHDKFYLDPGNGLLFNAYVREEYRGRGIYKMLQFAVHDYLFNINCRQVYTIVEGSNTPSLKASQRFGLACVGKNYLIKFLKYNIFSIYRWDKGLKIYYVFKNAKGNNI